MVGPLLRLASPAGRKGRLSVLVLHRVLPAFDPMFPEALEPQRFDSVCRWLRSMFNVLALDEAVDRLKQGTLPPSALAITFDDGYADNAEVAMPVLLRHGLKATVFVTTGFLNGGCMWNDIVIESVRRTRETRVVLDDWHPDAPRGPLDLGDMMNRRSLAERLIGAVKYLAPEERLIQVRALAARLGVQPPTDLMMRSETLQAWSRAGLQVGAHTITHPILTTLDDAAVRREIQGGREALEEIVDQRVGLFAYPNGQPGQDYDGRTVAIVRSLGFDAAFTTAKGAASARSDLMQLPRFTPWDRTPLRFGLRMAANLWSVENRVAA